MIMTNNYVGNIAIVKKMAEANLNLFPRMFLSTLVIGWTVYGLLTDHGASAQNLATGAVRSGPQPHLKLHISDISVSDYITNLWPNFSKTDNLECENV